MTNLVGKSDIFEIEERNREKLSYRGEGKEEEEKERGGEEGKIGSVTDTCSARSRSKRKRTPPAVPPSPFHPSTILLPDTPLDDAAVRGC